MSDASKYHGNAGLVGSGNHLVIPDGAARLNDGSDTSFSRIIDAVPEREKRI
jgi:hypothetical protein